MKKKLTRLSTVFSVCGFLLFSSPPDKQELYIKAISETDLQQKHQLLQQYEQLYGQQQDNYSKFIYIQLTETAFQLKNYEEAIQYGEKALEFAEIPATNKLSVLYALANSYHTSQKDPQKVYDYAETMIELTRWVIDKANNSDLEKEKLEEFVESYRKYYMATGYRLQAMVLYSREKENPAVLKEAAQKAVEAYLADKSENSAKMVFSLAGQLFQKNKLDDALAAAEKVFDETNPNERFATFLGTLYYKKGDKDKAIPYFELAYQAGKQAETALKIGKLVYKKDIDKGIHYFADAYILSQSDENSDAYKYLRQLYYNEKARNLPQSEQEKGFKAIILAAKARIGR